MDENELLAHIRIVIQVLIFPLKNKKKIVFTKKIIKLVQNKLVAKICFAIQHQDLLSDILH
jgi:hypothetical protein